MQNNLMNDYVMRSLFEPQLRLPEKDQLEFVIKNKGEILSILGSADVRSLYEEIEERKQKIPTSPEVVQGMSDVEIRGYIKEMDILEDAQKALKNYQEQRTKTLQDIADGKGILITNEVTNQKEPTQMENLEIRSLQKYLINGMKSMTDEEQRALNVSGSSVAIPTEVFSKLLSSEKYGDLLYRATQINDPRPGNVSIPIASNNQAAWKIENSSVDGSAASYEASPTLSAITLGGKELYRVMQMSAAASSLSAPQFEEMLLNLLGAEVIEELERSFIQGDTAKGEPKGLDKMTWDASNQKLTASSVTPIGPEHIAEAISLMPARYSRNAIILCNTKTLFNISMFKGTTEYAFDLQMGAQQFLNKPIAVNEHVADNVVYIVSPEELYVRFSMPLQLEADRSAGFMAANVALRALTVCDFAFNPKAVARVGLGA